MKLIKCNVSSFGALKDFCYEFSAGINTVKQDNGWGKSTFAAFIKSMFYGLSDGKRSVAENERIKYRPWNSTERFGGSLVFEWAGKTYKIERFFGNKAAEDTVRLFDGETGKEYSRTEDLGKRVFGIDEEGFLSTAFFSQKDFEVKSNTSLTAKYNEVCEIQDAELFDKAVANLEARAKEYRYRGDKGLISDVKREIYAVNGKIERAALARETAENLKKDAETLEKDLNVLKERAETLRAQSAEAGRAEAVALKKASYEKAVKEKEFYLSEKAASENVLNGRAVDFETLSSVKECVDEYEKIRTKRIMLKEEAEKLQKIIKPEEPPKKQSAGKFAIIFLIFAAITLVSGAAFAFFNVAVAAVLLSVGTVSAVISILFSVKNRKIKTESQKTSEVYSDYVAEKRRELEEYAGIEAEYRRKFDGFFSAFSVPAGDYYGMLSALSAAAEKRNEADLKIAALQMEISALSADKDVFGENTKTYDLKRINEEAATVSEWYKQKADMLARTKARISGYESEADEIPDLENRLGELNEKAAEYNRNYELLNLTLSYLKKADENLKIKYRAPLGESLNKYLSYITGGKTVAEIDVDLKITAEGGGSTRDVDFFSKGYKNLFEICKRFALADVLFTKERPFMILDDPFYNLDDSKLTASLELLKKLQNEYQILYLVCHESRRV